MNSLECDHLLPTTPEVSFEIAIMLALSWLIALTYIVAFCALWIDIVGIAA